jgi:DNA-binding NarL/FixJ family response regulator
MRTTETRQTTVVLAVESPIVILGMRVLFAPYTSYRIVAEARQGRQTCEAVDLFKPDVLLLDLSTPGMPAVEVIRHVARSSPETRILAWSAHGEPACVSSALKCGASGYVLKSDPADELVPAVRNVTAGGRYLSPGLRNTTFDHYIAMPGGPSSDDRYGRLSPREREVLHLVAEGRTSLAIAERLSVSRRTIEVHRRNIRRKLGLHNTAELTRYALQLTAAGGRHC